ncbi:peptidylprolyl isomerase [Sphingomonas sp.]|uniref:peptidylprolyl isomerase n=1 Tax=Sphingomonas sp. TaxID=28214 RepID=UPI002BBBECB2|nr:peptidylprolyl isomerase [Sphingomonas sp.]HWK36050.1 peptidylprolyl isomerase [Sphingomonas sp.]
MTRRFALCLLALLCAFPAAAQTPPADAAPAPAPAPQPAETVRVALTTTAGAIVLELDRTHAPITTANFLRYVDARRFDGIAFFRAMNLSWGGGLIQAGIRDAAKLYPPIAHEPTTQTGLHHTEGTISMARMAPGTATADFTIMLGDMTGLDAHPDQPGDNAGYAAFGHVIEGMDVVKAIAAMPVSATLGEGVMKGQYLAQPVKILTARRVP